MNWHRAIEVIKWVSPGRVKLSIPLLSISVKEIAVESWYIDTQKNSLEMILHRQEKVCPIQLALEEKRKQWETPMYPGERLR